MTESPANCTGARLSAKALAVPCVVSAGLGARPFREAPAMRQIDPDHLGIAFLVEHAGGSEVLDTFRKPEDS